MESLPIIPTEFRYKIAAGDAGMMFKVIAKQVNRKDVDRIVIATDAKREGELIARLILKMAGIDERSGKQLFRFWTSGALTPVEIKATMSKLKPLSEYDRLYYAAAARQQADWLVGINGTRAATLTARGMNKGGVVSLGRVQTPTLYILAKRSKEITNFKPEKYYEVEGSFAVSGGEYKGKLIDETGKVMSFKTRQEAEGLFAALSGLGGVITSVEKKNKRTEPPVLYSLSGVQKEASSKYGIRASETLDILQSLYDKKFTTYPRSGSEVLSDEMVLLAQKTVSALGFCGYDVKRCKVEADNKRVFNSAKLTDHHAIIPTGTKPSGLSDNEQRVYDMVCKRFIAAFYPDYIYEATEIVTQADNKLFKTTGNRTLDLGWKAVLGSSETDSGLPALSKGDEAVGNIGVLEKETTPPKHYTDGTLIADMENAHKFVKDESLKKFLKDNAGIGTPATQAGIIDTLVKRGYVEIKGKSLIITTEGAKLVDAMESEQVCDPAYTALWERSLDDIATGKIANGSAFIESTKQAVKQLVNNIRGKDLSGVTKIEARETKSAVGKCPVCGSAVLEWEKGYSCSNRGNCKFVLWKNKLSFVGKAVISEKEAAGLLNAFQEERLYN